MLLFNSRGTTRSCSALAVIIITFLYTVASYRCVPVPDVPCSCEYNGQLVDLSFGDFPFPLKVNNEGYTYYYNPCSELHVDQKCTQSSVCQQDVKEQQWYPVGSSGTFSGVPGVDLVLSHAVQFDDSVNRSSVVSLDCQEEEPTSFTFDVKKQLSNTSDEYHFTLSGEVCCLRAKDTKLSAGSVLVIIFFVLLFVYFAGGIFCNWCVRGYTGIEVVPHCAFWADLPSLVTDGWKFVLTCGCCKRAADTAPSYDNI